ncbi:MAG: AraC family transcriptional regulator [Pirellulales bacterium]
MDGQNDNRRRIASLLNEVVPHGGIHQTLIDGVHVARHSTPLPRTPVVYEPVIVVVGQGRKRGYFGDEVYVYDPLNYLVLSVPLPVECEWEASPEEPLLLVAISVEPTMLGEILLELDEQLPPVSPMPRGISTGPLSVELSGAVIRLLECLKCAIDSRILGRQMVREIVYRVLRDEQGESLRALASRDEHFTRIARVLKHIHTDCAQPLTVESMAKRAGMSIAAFHHNFKLVTASPPLQYLKRIRLERARRLMAHDGHNASTAARAVGYESPSQFSREFKRLFSVTPVEGAEQMRARFVAG